MSAPKARSNFGDGQIDIALSQVLAAIGSDSNDDLIRKMLVTALDMDMAELPRLELKIASQTLVEMLNTYRVFAPYADRMKVTVFGSARTKVDHPNYILAKEFSAKLAAHKWMVISGAGPGIMTAAIEGAGIENSLGINIELPFEQEAASIIAGDPKLATFKYFFTRKVTFVKEADGFLLLPGGFGTHDEGFELLTLIQTGKSYPAPIVMLDHPGSSYWSSWLAYVKGELLKGGMISSQDLALIKHTHDPDEAVSWIVNFFSCYHSLRYLPKRVIVRLQHEVSDSTLAAVNDEFGDILLKGEIVRTEPSRIEIAEDDCVSLPRLALSFNNRDFSRLTELILRLNELSPGAEPGAKPVHRIGPDPADQR